MKKSSEGNRTAHKAALDVAENHFNSVSNLENINATYKTRIADILKNAI